MSGEVGGLEAWRENREGDWFRDIGYRLQNAVSQHRYDTRTKGSKPDDPGWHECTCGWEGYWSDFEPHVADHLRARVRVWLTEALAAPEVVEAAARGIRSSVLISPLGTNSRAVQERGGSVSLTSTEAHDGATAALSAAADALRAGVTR